MPIFIKNYSWRQTSHSIFIRVPLKRARKSCMDIFMLDNFIKVSHPPFLFEIFLARPVKYKETKCTVIDDELVFEIWKEEGEEWEYLEMQLDKQQKLEMKKELVEKSQTVATDKRSIRLQKMSEREKLSVNEQMKLDSKCQKEIEELRLAERNSAIEDFKLWRQDSVKEKENIETNIFSAEDLKKTSVTSQHLKGKGEKEMIYPFTTVGTSIQLSSQDKKKSQFTPSIRDCGKIKIQFTPREFPTPCRESKLPEEEEWLRKQADARKASGFVSEDLRPEERDPQWLKEKGDSFFKLGNYLGAVSAYSHGIKLSNKMAALFSNRSAAHLALNNFHKAAEDASKALELLEPPVEANRESRAKAHVRRGTALCNLGSLKYGLLDFEAALKLVPLDDKLCQDIENVKSLIKNQNEADSEASDDEEY